MERLFLSANLERFYEQEIDQVEEESRLRFVALGMPRIPQRGKLVSSACMETRCLTRKGMTNDAGYE